MPDAAEPTPTRQRPRRPHAVLVGAVDGLLGIALPFAVLVSLAVLAWAALGRAEAWSPYVSGAADAWLIGHGVDIRFAVPGSPFTVTVAALGPALVTLLCAVRAGRRAVETEAPITAWVAGLVTTVVASVALLRVGTSAAATPVAWQAVALPLVVVVLGSLIGMRSGRTGAGPVPAGVRTGLAAVLLVLAAAAVALTVLLLLRFADVVALDESLDAGAAGGFVLTCLQVLALPTFVVWAASWLLGAGVALGTGSVTGPFVGQAAPLPALPVLGAVPVDPPAWAATVLLLPVLAGFGAAAIARRSGATTPAVPLGLVAGVVAGLVLGGLAAASAGSVGPGRFTAVGPDALLVAGLATALIGLPAMIGAAVVRPRAGESGAGREAQ